MLVTPENEDVELSYLFVEPEAFGTGLADTPYSAGRQLTIQLHPCFV